MRSEELRQRQGFSKTAKIAMVSAVVIAALLILLRSGAFGETVVNLSLFTNPNLERGLIAHWTFDGAYTDLSSTTAEVRARVGANNGNVFGVPQGGFPVVESYTIYESTAEPEIRVHTIDAPTGVEEGDLLVQLWMTRAHGGANHAFDTDWTERVFIADENGGEYIAVGTKRATASEPATYDFDLGNSRDAVGFIIRISGDDDTQSNPIHVSNTTNESGFDQEHIAPSVTTTANDTLVFYSVADSTGGNWAEDSGYPSGTTLVGVRSSDSGDSTNALGGLSYKEQASAGASGTGEFNSTTGFNQSVLATFAIAPAQAESATVPGRLGQRLKFDGENNYASFGNVGTANTIAFWMKVATTTNNMKIINIDGTDQIELDGSSNVVATSFPAATVYVDGSSASANISDTGWHHVVVTDTTGVSASTFEVGRVSSSYFGGIIDDVRVYNRAISQDEITRLYQIGATTRINFSLITNPNLENGLVGHWTLDGKDLVENAVDRSGSGNTGYLENFSSTTTLPGRIGQALDFDGTDDLVNVGSDASLDNIRTISACAWVNWGGGGDDGRIYFKPAESAGNNAIGLLLDTNASGSDDYFEFRYPFATATGRWHYQGVTTETNRWYHVCATYNGNSTSNDPSMYIDGISVTVAETQAPSGSVSDDSTFDASIGDRTTATAQPFDGRIDDVRVYDRILSAEDVERLYQLGATTKIGVTIPINEELQSDLVSHWTFDGTDVSGVTATDRAGSNHGTIRGAATRYDSIVDGLGPEARYKLNGNDGSDSTGNGHGATSGSATAIASIVPVTPVTNNADFDGSTQEFGIPDAPEMNTGTGYAGTERAISTWINADTIDTTGNGRAIWSEGGSTNSMNMYVFNDGADDRVYCNAVESANNDFVSAVISENTTYHVGCMWNFAGGRMDMYVNGALADSDTSLAVGTALVSHSGNIALGGVDANTDNHAGSSLSGNFDGTIADLAYFSDGVVLDTTDFADIYNAGSVADNTVIGRIGQGLNFDGVDNYVDVGNIGTGLNSFAFWVKTSTTTLSIPIVDVNGTNQIETDAGGNIAATGFSSPTIYVNGDSASARIATSTWQHVAVVNSSNISGSDFDIGRIEGEGYFGGVIDDVRVYNRAISQDEITRLYQLGAGR